METQTITEHKKYNWTNGLVGFDPKALKIQTDHRKACFWEQINNALLKFVLNILT